MTKLEDLEKELYESGEEEELSRRLSKRSALFKIMRKVPSAWQDDAPPPAGPDTSVIDRRILRVFFGVVAIAVAVGAASFVFFFLGTRGGELALTIPARSVIEAGEIVTIPVSLRNTSRNPLREVEFALMLPPGTLIHDISGETPAPPRISRSVEDLAPGESRVVEVAVRMFGREGEEKKIEATVLYRPEKLRARFSTDTEKTIRIGRVPIGISFALPESISRGQEVEVAVRYTSSANHPFEDMRLQLEYPTGFTFRSSKPPLPDGESAWDIGTLEPGGAGEVIIRGVLSGEEGEVKPFRAVIGAYTASREWVPYIDGGTEARLAVTPLVVESALDGERDAIVTSGSKLRFVVRYRNNTASTLKNVTIRSVIAEHFGGSATEPIGALKVAGERALVFRTLAISDGGVYNAASQAMVWGPGSTPELRSLGPEASGEFEFTIDTRARPNIQSVNEKNLALVLRSTISVAGVPEELTGVQLSSEDVAAYKVASPVLFSGKNLYRGSALPTSGPLPPKVGKKTVYTILWEIRNFTSDITDADVRAVLPTGAVWENNFTPKGAPLTFDAASNEIRWRIGRIPAGTGVTSSAMSVSFQVSVTPTVADTGKAMPLLNETVLSGTDSFTRLRVEQRLKAFTTELRDDPLSKPTEWVVAP